jgi:hypothetical protein
MKGESARWCRILSVLFALAVMAVAPLCFAQQLTGTLTGTVYDSTGAVVPKATVTMKNVATGDIRTTTTDGSGYFSITAIQPATYDITIAATGFQNWVENAVVFHQGDTRALAGVKLQPGTQSETVTVNGGDVGVPLDNGELSTTLSSRMIEDVPLVGRDAAELIKTIPGMVFTNGLSQGSAFNDQIVQSNNGPAGNFSSNGTQPNGAVAMMLDGANLIDPGNAGSALANINQDDVAEFKALTNDYSAEYAKGPTILQFLSKSGTNKYHGELYDYARRGYLDSVDWYVKKLGGTNSNDHYNYLGGNAGGPLWPGNKKVFVFGDYEHMDQAPVRPPVTMNVPTLAQVTPVNGMLDFTNSNAPAGAISQWPFMYGTPYNPPTGWTASGNGGLFPVAAVDSNFCGGQNPCTGAGTDGLLGLFQCSAPSGLVCPAGKGGPWAANMVPTAANGWFNYSYTDTTPVNRWEALGKVDYDFSPNTKLTVSYTRQDEGDLHPIGVWWTPPWTLPYPSEVSAAVRSDIVMSNFTHVFNPTTTNEFVFTFARFINPTAPTNESAVSRQGLGWNVPGLFSGHGSAKSQIPDINGAWGGSSPYIINFPFDGGFNGGGFFGATKQDPAIYDNFTKVMGAHTIKAGVYWDTSENIQSTGGLQAADAGAYNFGWGGGDTGNVMADMLTGTGFTSYQEESSIPVLTLKYHQWSIYAQDSWQMTKQLTINAGLRFDHVGQWYGPQPGLQVWNGPTNLSQGLVGGSYTVNAFTGTPNNEGIEWHGTDSSIPSSGISSPLFYFEPRFSFAYDVFGNGKSSLRGGYAIFHYQLSQNDVGGAAQGPLGSFTYTSAPFGSPCNKTPSGPCGYGAIGQFTPPSAVAQNGSSITVLQQGDNATPMVADYNLSWSQAAPWGSVFEVSYVGNKSSNLYMEGSNGNLGNLNNVPVGGFWFADPRNHVLYSPAPPPCTSGAAMSIYCQNNANYNTTLNALDYVPLQAYQNIYLNTHGAYANYNSLQASWAKQAGSLYFVANYTFSKALGIWDWTSDNGAAAGNTVDPYNIRDNYGPLAYDHTQLFNIAYSYNIPDLLHHGWGTRVVNGWKLTGYTTVQSGAPIEPNGDLNVVWPGGLTVPTVGQPDLPDYSVHLPNGLVATSISPSSWFGTNAYHFLMPALTCNPAKNLPSGYYFNPNCFAPPAYGAQGPLEWPYIHGPAFFDSDLGLGKQFKITESKNIEFRIQTTNWLNHPVPEFGTGTPVPISDNELNFTGQTPATVDGQKATLTYLAPSNTNTLTTGKPANKVGNRIIMLVAKFNF